MGLCVILLMRSASNCHQWCFWEIALTFMPSPLPPLRKCHPIWLSLSPLFKHSSFPHTHTIFSKHSASQTLPTHIQCTSQSPSLAIMSSPSHFYLYLDEAFFFISSMHYICSSIFFFFASFSLALPEASNNQSVMLCLYGCIL